MSKKFVIWFILHNNVKLWLDGELIIDRQTGDPYLPAYHRPSPDAKLVTKAGKHTLKLEVTVADNNEPFIVAFQAVDLADVFVKNRGWLQDDIFISYNS